MNIEPIKQNFKYILAIAAMTGSSVYENELTRPAIIDYVEKMIKCRNLKYGYLFFECPNCNNYHLQGLSCHSRFCPSCNQRYRDARTLAIQSKLLEANHRHFVFSIAKELRKYFFHYRGLFDVLFNTVNQALHKTIRQSKLKRKLNLKLGVICFLHTYGRDMKPNPHIHALIAEKTLDDLNHLKNFFYFPFDRLRMFYQYLLLQNMSAYLKVHAPKDVYREFNILCTFLNNKYKKGFYTMVLRYLSLLVYLPLKGSLTISLDTLLILLLVSLGFKP
ncbi:transposase zinc-binding domain-containing protein [Acholeplasma vituli]|uniref:Transposase zinc-binding domain-containing protein n=1 Tax=Paracholeplasma vituli TaxID=69473 RepID=A0ABT2PUJ0_9MOLU|nr:transposase zinc-binding domain-containing protein [Paracholeplasma vituli]MCU0104101.1 transposase zinc-binding domain-containing protein [Paracholeplasma vituli]